MTADQAGWMVFTEVFYPGSRASIDGAPVPVHRAFGVFQAVAVPAGSHAVVIAHRPTLWPLFAAAFAGLVVACIIARRWSPARADIEALLIANRDSVCLDYIRREWSMVATDEELRTAWLEDAIARLLPRPTAE